ncbi:MAG: AAA-like domain-containing protein [Phormidesmis sp.]
MAKAVKKILFLAANPKATSRLSLDEEAKKIRQGLERSRGREGFEIITRWAVDADELRRSLLDIEPHIVHFSGHGIGAGGLALHAAEGKAKLADSEALANLFSLFAEQIECVLLNACYSEEQAKAIYQHVNCVIGMSQAVGDRTAIKFSEGFYDALGAGKTYDIAYRFGCSAIDFEDVVESLTPVLMARQLGSSLLAADPIEPATEAAPDPEATGVILENPEGQVPLNSPFYVERSRVETDCYAAVTKPGALIRVKAARQMGKSSLMTRILDHGTQQGYRSVPIFFQEADGDIFGNLDSFLQWFCGIVAEELELPSDVETFWERGRLGSKRKCTNFFQKYVLPEIKTPLVLGLDEVDLIFQHLGIAQDFFALLRTWHERGKNQSVWQGLRLVIVHSREVYIPLDMHQSPFNVGVPIDLEEFTPEQIRSLAKRHGLSLAKKEIDDLMTMLGGHPYLVRVALYEIARGRSTLAHLLEIAPTEEGPFADHLRRHLRNLRDSSELVNAIKQIINSLEPIPIGDAAFQLRSMGLIKLRKNAAIPLCNLYRRYFQERLKIEPNL